MIGNLGILSAFITALISGFFFFRLTSTAKSKIDTARKTALLFYHLHTFSLVLTSGYLLYALLTHQFQYFYVYAHSSLDLPFKYLLSAFWAGQEGTFLLWALITALAGYILFRKEKELLPGIMPVVLFSQAFLILFLILENPFFHLGQVPSDGMGLNPLLMDPWMVIHPPIVFIGYALLIYPFSYAVAVLWKGDWHKTILRALPWAVAGWFFLGLGILIGGAWAYRVLGWGGYWGWDPVENASLVPWLVGTALVHGLIAQKEKQVFQKSNLLLALATYLLIIFATFLTRSGVMADYSVHAFADTTLTYFILAFFLSLVLIGLFFFLKRFKEIPVVQRQDSYFSRRFSFSLTMFILILSASLIMLGTLSPVLTGLFASPAGVDEGFYLQTNAPLYFLLFATLAICPLLTWKGEGVKDLYRRLKYLLFVLPIAVIGGYMAGVTTWPGILLLIVIIAALAVNLVALRRVRKRGLRYSGGYLAHVGLALLMVGFLGSTLYTQSQVLALPRGETVEALGYEFSYLGLVVQEESNYPEVLIQLSDNRQYFARPSLYMAGNRLMRSPAIYRSLARDLYISPLEIQLDDSREVAVLFMNQAYKYQDYTLTFTGFQFEPHETSGVIEVGAVIELIAANTSPEEYIPTIVHDSQGSSSDPVILPEGEQLLLEGINADSGQITISLQEQASADRNELFIVEVKIKPLISLLIIGAVLLSLGMAIATWRRFA